MSGPREDRETVTDDELLRMLDDDTRASAAERVLALAVGYLQQAARGDGRVSTAHTPEELAARFDEPIPRSPASLEAVTERLQRDVLTEVNRLAHPKAMGHQVSPPLPLAIWMEPLIAALNQSSAVFEMSPTGTPIEHRVIRWMNDLAGFGASAGGVMTYGGTEATFTALLAARAHAIPDAWERGVGDDAPVVLSGEHAHYAVTRAVAQLGLGMRRAVAIPSRDFRMDVDALARTLEQLEHEGTRVMAVVATAGSTATGSFDDVEAIASLTEPRGIWLHVDGAHGGSALLSAAHRHRLRGVERAHSLAWDAHKMMLMPLPAGVLLVREERALQRAFSQSAPYLFHGAEGGARVWDQGTRSFACSRRVDAMKLWAALQRYGAEGMAALYDRLCRTTMALWHALNDAPGFEAMHVPESNILCFRWLGTRAWSDEAVDELNARLRERYNRSGAGWITTTMLGGRRVLRVTIMNPRTTDAHVRELVRELADEGAHVESEIRDASPASSARGAI
ncbi:MAG TPA: pyridoxal-dependent decarboxylase [Gemmatimonadaceae bacterium]|nr:pyridoxal-dependent decarboxylase [Gemmatimonadaceae bacterium]